jgi:hypothetical protein
LEQLTLFPEASHASLLVLPGSEKAIKMTVFSGLRCLELYRKCSLLGLLVKTLLGSSIWHSNKCALTWKIKIMKSNRLLFQLAASGLYTKEKEYLLWPTVRAAETGDYQYAHGDHAKKVMTLTGAVKMYENHPFKNLNDQIGGQLNPMWVEWLMGFPIGWTDLSVSETL